ncbi:LCP family protein [Microbacterium gubbeenense]|uniref:LCP family protein n=1 Tax=Microbacterium gubbeenense TaxID=159896 RepID=UPI003F99176F
MSSSSSHRPRGPVARHTKLRSPGVVPRILKGAAFALSAVLVAIVGVGAYAYNDYFGSLRENSVTLAGQDVNSPDVEVLPNEDVNILVTGVDKCEAEWADQFGDRCPPALVAEQEESYTGQLNDVNMIIHVSPEPRRVTVISIPRDMLTDRPACEDIDGNETSPASVVQFNFSYGTGGLDCVARTATELTGLEIDHAALMTWGGVIDITNAIGGVDVCLADPIPFDKETGLELEAGEHTLVGYEALQFLRTRKTLATGSDLDRIGNQQLYMGALVRKLVSNETFSDVPAMLRLANAVTTNAQVSTGLTDPMAMVSIAGALRGIPLEDYAFIQFPAADSPADPNRLIPVTESWDLIAQALEQNQPILLGEDDPPATETPAPTDTPEPTTDPTKVALPEYLRGSNANDPGVGCEPADGLF